ncbi:LysR family transcriptional regulator [Bradyrhizobium japonicum]|jgi:DNA-binding transcriptional LysR family regulator|uniref:DNA-binding transcriptional LysR family regulator n=1 Tax=Bradyrhizobium japonicum TaxID=375 RepID=A0ABV2RHH6_BRAJP|nr:LysR family transcriptional regulator [Bradyrhizobium japonicum]AJA59301.1 LysR family transcriptional regulator [Bradyrhizobium japonicum]KMJ94892.1 LysR family transcriptional regulator [Bradyrhizobium japonicum]MBR0728898.1 LysR family transcriptional regulator [Bradyrhizobium japonicum]MBR0748358.1 LysR family transcriptional regulator [Bradyrhizobium japonicum]MBR0762053.1 LysR family transcriptional regulator [Bradyrhizobium japonicum]
MELRHIRYFLAVAEERNFTRAAARVGIGQPPLSQQIKDLEAEVGAPLFHRIPQGAELTEAGRAFLESVQVIPRQAERAIRAAQRAARGEIGSLRVGFTNSAPFNPVVTSTIRSFRRAYPEVDLTLEEAYTSRLVVGLREGELDAVFLRPDDGGSDLQFRRLAKESMLVVLPANHPAAKLDRIDLIRLKDDALILTPRRSIWFDTAIRACRQAGFEPTLGQSAPQISSVVSLVAAELGFSLVPASLRQLHVTGVVYREVKGGAPTVHLALAFRRGETSKIVLNFIAIAQAAA